MGYTTEFEGKLIITPTLSDNHKLYLQTFSEIRHMKRDIDKLKDLPDLLRKNVNLPLGIDGEYYIGADTSNFGQNHTSDIIDYNKPAGHVVDYNNLNNMWETNSKLIEEGKAQPGLWCNWTVNDEGTEFIFDGGEKFYRYIHWLSYLINNFYEPWNYKLNGEFTWEGEESSDTGKIKVVDNVIGVADSHGDKKIIEPNPVTHYEDVGPKRLN